jgi:hypothetical protein
MQNETTTIEFNTLQITIEGHHIQALFYKDQPVITFKMMDQVHERQAGTAKKNFGRNRGHFIENEDFFKVPYEEYKHLTAGSYCPRGDESEEANKLLAGSYCPRGDESEEANKLLAGSYCPRVPGSRQRNPMIFLTAVGYMLLVKSFTDDRAWKVQRALSTKYFQSRPASAVPQIENRKARVKTKTDDKKQQIAYADSTMKLEITAKQVADRIFKGNGNINEYEDCTDLYELIQAELAELNKDSLFPAESEV